MLSFFSWLKYNAKILFNILCFNFALRLNRKDFFSFLCFLPLAFAVLYLFLFVFYFTHHFYFLERFDELSDAIRLKFSLNVGINSWQFLITPLLFCLHFVIFTAINSRLKFIFLFLNFYLLYCLLFIPIDVIYLTVFAIFYAFLLIFGVILIFFKNHKTIEIPPQKNAFIFLIFIICNLGILWFFGSGDIKRVSNIFDLIRISMSASIWLFLLSIFALLVKAIKNIVK